MHHTTLKQTDISTPATQKVLDRFVIVPTSDSRPKFRDLWNPGTAPQGNPMMLAQAYRDFGGAQEINGESLLYRLPVVYAETFKPGDYRRIIEANGNRLLNLWIGSEVRPSGQKLSREQATPFYDFLQRLFPLETERNYFLNWLAHVVRHPEKRVNATVLLRSSQGVGKGFLTEVLITGLLGKSSVGTVALGDVVGNFNDALVGKTLILIDEVYRNPESTVNALKSIQGNKTITLRRKHIPDTTVDNYLSFLMSSNDANPLLLDSEDRRFWVPAFINHKESRAETMLFLNSTLKPWLMEQGGMQIVRDLLETVDLSGFEPWGDPPMTDSKRAMIGLKATSQLTSFVAEQIKETLVVKAQDIETLYFIKYTEKLGNRMVPTQLAAQGCKGKRTTRERFWITPKGLAGGLSETSSPAELRHAYGLQ